MTNRGRAAGALAVALLAPGLAAAQLPSGFIGTFPTEASDGLDPARPVAAVLTLHPRRTAHVGSLRRWFPSARAEGERVRLRLLGYPAAGDRPLPAQRAPSFYVDFDEPAVQALKPAIVERYGPQPGLEELARFVDERIARKSARRLLDPASTVARRGEGDCTEHAVLLAAVARLFGHPARVVDGLAVLDVGGRWTAFGHAWTEIHDGRAWRLADATHPPAGHVVYLPLGIVEDEGPGFAAGARRSLSIVDVAGVSLAPAPE